MVTYPAPTTGRVEMGDSGVVSVYWRCDALDSKKRYDADLPVEGWLTGSIA